MEEFRNQLKILHHQDITLQDALLISSASPMQDVSSLSKLPAYMLSRIMMLDCASRQLPSSLSVETGNNQHTSVLEILKSGFQSKTETGENSVNPMDVFLFLFIQCQSIFRQTFAIQVSRCQLSLPLIISYPSPQNPTLYVFALKTLYKVYLNADNVSTSFSVTEKELPIVSFIRIGDCDNSQKSDMLNRVLGISEYFYDRNQRGNCQSRLFLDGSVDIAWFLPKIKERKTVICDEPFVILNLRGDAWNFPIQRKFISTVSSFLYVFIAINQCDPSLSQNLKEFHNEYGSKAIYLLYRGEKSLGIEYLDIPEFVKNLSDTVLFLERKNLGEDSNILGKNISTRIQNERNRPKISLTDCIPIARKLLLRVDVDESNIESSRCVVNKIMTKLLNSDSIEKKDPSQLLAALKQSMLPLQGCSWSQWAEYTRELNSFEYKEQKNITEKLREARKEQIQTLLKPSSLLTDILHHCRTFGMSSNFYITWILLQNEFNSLSKRYLPPLYEEYRRLYELSISSELRKTDKSDEKVGKQKELKDSLGRAAKAIAKSSFGLEHIFRELGQFFEAYHYNNIHEFTDLSKLEQNLSFQFEKLPDIAASLLIEGHSFEILDGDVNHVPITWVTEVLKCLAYKIGNKKRVFVLSVLGTQSTGKSTLLNTMFGANFPVSSGRCTRGIFIQLIPIEAPLASKLGYDYVILLDTEGLRAPELSISSSYRRDNELATFAVGLGDVTVINMYGEGHSEVQDILQIIIFAFIRMKESSYSKPRCMFVHQNVPDSQAHTNLLVARSNLMKTLDKMTVCAAQQENKNPFYKRFCDVIDFRPEKEVFYFPGLFEGEAPLHRIAPAYANSSANLRERILKCFSDTGKEFQTVLTWSEKLTKLWKAVLCENFVFSYKNAMEVTARFQLDNELSSWYSNYIRSWIFKKSESLNLLFNGDLAEVDTILERLLSELREESNTPTLESESEKSLKNFFFTDHDNKEVFCQWEANTSSYIQRKRDAYIQKIEEEYKMVSNVQKTKKEIDTSFSNFRKEIVLKVRSLFEEMNLQGKSLKNKANVESQFKAMWDEWRAQIRVDMIPENEISKDVQRALSESSIIKSMRIISTKKDLIMDASKFVLYGSKKFTDLSQLNSDIRSNYFTHHDLIEKKSSSFPIFSFLSTMATRNPLLNQFTTLIILLNSQCEMQIREYSYNFVKNECPYDPNTFFVVIERCYHILNDHNLDEGRNVRSSILLTSDFKFDFIFYQCCKAIPIFQKIQKDFLSKVSLNNKFFCLESQLRRNFTELCEGIESEYLCAKEMASITMQGLKHYLANFVSPLLIKKFKEDINHQSDFHSRASLILRILKDLAREKNFEDYISYITKPTNFIIEYVRKQITKYINSKTVLKEVEVAILKEVNLLVDLYIRTSKDACPYFLLSYTTEKSKIWEKFKKNFYSKIIFKTRNVSLSDLDVLDIYSISEYEQFCGLYAAELEKLVKGTNWLQWTSEILREDDMIHAAITDPFLECQALCPFCKELCQLNAGYHEHYCGTFHRPNGLNGWRDYYTKKIYLRNCTHSIKAQGQFIYQNIVYNYVDYKTVNGDFNSWKILGSDDTDSKYWQWVLYRFKNKFLEYYNIDDNSDIQAWKYLKEKQIISDLENHYKSEMFRRR